MRKYAFALALTGLMLSSFAQKAEVTYNIDGIEMTWKEAVLYSDALIAKGEAIRELLQKAKDSEKPEDVAAVEAEVAKPVSAEEVKAEWAVKQAEEQAAFQQRLEKMQQEALDAQAAEAEKIRTIVKEELEASPK